MLNKRTALESILTKPKLTRWSDVSKSLGNEFYTLDGTRVERGQRLPKNERLPAILDSNKIVAGDLIPHTSWGSSLANMLTKTSWDKLRLPLIEQNNNVCEVCGTRHRSLDVHEVWSYAMPEQAKIKEAQQTGGVAFGVQTLEGLIAICKECHKIFHFGLANANGELEQVLSRLGAINGWSKQEVSTYYDLVADRYQQASSVYWGLDFSRVEHPDGGLTLKDSWQVYEPEPRLIENEGRFGQNITAILNNKWKHDKDKNWKPVLTVEEFNS
jgi:hypothetical protein